LHGSIQHVIDFPGDGGVTAGESWWSYSNFRHRCVAYSTCRSQLTTINGLPRPFIKTPLHVVEGFKRWHPSVCLSVLRLFVAQLIWTKLRSFIFKMADRRHIGNRRLEP